MSNERRMGAGLPAEQWAVTGAGAEHPARPVSSETRQQRPERPLESSATASSLGSAAANHGRAELERVCQRLRQLVTDERALRAVHSPWLLRDAKELLAALQQPGVAERLLRVGLAPARLDELSFMVHAIETIEAAIEAELSAEVRRARDDKQRALELRDELLSACQWNLRDEAAADALARITSSGCVDELVLDLRELARLVSQHASAFARDRTIAAPQQSQRALELAERLLACVRLGRLRMNEDTWPGADTSQAQQLSASCQRAYEALGRLLHEVRAAGRHAYRADGARRRWFAEHSAARPSLLCALAARA